MKPSANILGYLVLDEGFPVKDNGDEGSGFRFHPWENSKSPIALFGDVKTARRVKAFFQRKYYRLASEFDSGSPAQAHTQGIWKKRAESLRIKRVASSHFKAGVLALLLVVGIHARAQKPVDFALDAADAAIRALDVTSTHALLASPCRCFREDDPLSPNTRKVWPLAAFQAGMSAGAIEGGRRLALHGHPRLGRFVLLADIAGEVWAVQHNYRQHEPAPKASGLTPRQRGLQ